eukprot:COSAG02_NODE_59396_length_274_cov_0.880000_1_plen_26_part_01
MGDAESVEVFLGRFGLEKLVETFRVN